MEDITERYAVEVVSELILEGHRLRVIAREVTEGQWELAVENALAVRSVWFEWFPTAQAAIDTGINAIHDEGVATFVDVTGFEYLPDSRRN